MIWGYRLPQDAASRKTSLDLSVGERGHISVGVVCVWISAGKNVVYVSKKRVFLFFFPSDLFISPHPDLSMWLRELCVCGRQQPSSSRLHNSLQLPVSLQPRVH